MEWTSISIKKPTKEKLARLDEKDGRDWDTFLRRELLGEDIDGADDVPERREITGHIPSDMKPDSDPDCLHRSRVSETPDEDPREDNE